MPPQNTSTPTSTSSPDLAALVERLRGLDTDLVQHRLTLAYALDDLGATLEQSRQVRTQLVGLLAREVSR